MQDDSVLRRQLVRLLTVRQAHMDFEDAVAEFPEDHINRRPPQCEYSYWHLIEHLRICQRDILDYIISDDYMWPNFPDDYWPDRASTTDAAGWQRTVAEFQTDRQSLVEIISDRETDLFAPLVNSGEHRHTVLREAHIVASHNAYHVGELAILRQVEGLWPSDRRA
jgi:hypothetical protein